MANGPKSKNGKKIGQKIENGPRPEIGKKWSQNGKKMGFKKIRCFQGIFKFPLLCPHPLPFSDSKGMEREGVEWLRWHHRGRAGGGRLSTSTASSQGRLPSDATARLSRVKKSSSEAAGQPNYSTPTHTQGTLVA